MNGNIVVNGNVKVTGGITTNYTSLPSFTNTQIGGTVFGNCINTATLANTGGNTILGNISLPSGIWNTEATIFGNSLSLNAYLRISIGSSSSNMNSLNLISQVIPASVLNFYSYRINTVITCSGPTNNTYYILGNTNTSSQTVTCISNSFYATRIA